MPSEKFFVHKEDGSLVRLKGRLVRFLDEEPPTGSDKSAIRTALEVSPDAEGLVQADVGTDPNQLVLHQHLGDISYQSADSVSMGAATVDNDLTVGNATTGGQVQVIGGAASAPSFAFSNDPDTGMSRPTSNAVNFVTGGTERVRIDSSGQVGIGSTPSINLGGGLSVDGGSGYVNLNLVKGSAGTGHAVDFSDENGALQFRVGTNFSSGGNNLIFARGTGSTIAWKIDSATGNLVANSTGIDFGSGASTTLDDYEEGTWTPALSTGTGESITYAAQAGNYTKIGNLVHCTGRIQITTAATYGSYGHLQIAGVPFTIEDAARGISFSYGGNYSNPSLFQVGDITGAQAQSNGASTFYLQRGAYGGTSDVYYRTALLNTTGHLQFSLTYHTAQ